eukprot:28653-Eustigmatos_ZCMA.PRE.1
MLVSVALDQSLTYSSPRQRQHGPWQENTYQQPIPEDHAPHCPQHRIEPGCASAIQMRGA